MQWCICIDKNQDDKFDHRIGIKNCFHTWHSNALPDLNIFLISDGDANFTCLHVGVATVALVSPPFSSF